MPISQDNLDNWFMYHDLRASPSAQASMAYIRDAAKSFAEAIVTHTPSSADQSAAIRKVREAMMTANAAIACGGE